MLRRLSQRSALARRVAARARPFSTAMQEDVAGPAPGEIYGDEHLAIMDTIKRFVDDEINPHVDEWEAAGAFPAHELFKKLGDLGLLGLCKPVENGGQGLDFSYAVAAAEALGHCDCGAIPMAIGVQTDMATPALARFGGPEVRRQFLAPSISGDFVACLGVSEVGAGSDVAGLATTAVKDGDDYVINGGKMWTTNGSQADWMCLLANTSGVGSDAHSNKTMICLPMDSPGLSRSPRLDKLGMRSSDTVQVTFEDVRVPQAYRIGDEGRGFVYQMLQFQEERLFGAAAGLLAMERAIAQTVEYTSARKVFGKPIIANQAVRFRLAELQTEVEHLRALIYRATAKYVGGGDATLLASMAKLKMGRLNREVADSCLQYFGGMGFMSETPISRFFRDSRLASIGGGADEVMLEILGKMLGYGAKKK
jgi:citronellyl-CoA dehydrogenase